MRVRLKEPTTVRGIDFPAGAVEVTDYAWMAAFEEAGLVDAKSVMDPMEYLEADGPYLYSGTYPKGASPVDPMSVGGGDSAKGPLEWNTEQVPEVREPEDRQQAMTHVGRLRAQGMPFGPMAEQIPLTTREIRGPTVEEAATRRDYALAKAQAARSLLPHVSDLPPVTLRPEAAEEAEHEHGSAAADLPPAPHTRAADREPTKKS